MGKGDKSCENKDLSGADKSAYRVAYRDFQIEDGDVLTNIIWVWSVLPDHVKLAIKALIETAIK